jgi:hypothetical protein
MMLPRRRRQSSNAIAYALWANEAVLTAILVVLIGRDNSLKLTPAAFGQAQPVGGGGLFVMPAQMSQGVWGCYVMDIDAQTLAGYQMTGSPPESLPPATFATTVSSARSTRRRRRRKCERCLRRNRPASA